MTPVRNSSTGMGLVAEGQGASLEFDEEFLRLVDRVDLAHKQGDPYRLDQVHRALQEEVYLAHLGGETRPDRPHRGDRF